MMSEEDMIAAAIAASLQDFNGNTDATKSEVEESKEAKIDAEP